MTIIDMSLVESTPRNKSVIFLTICIPGIRVFYVEGFHM